MHSRIGFFLLGVTLVCSPASAQTTPPHQHPPSPPSDTAKPAPEQPHAGHGDADGGMFSSRDSSGTAWLPDASPMYGVEIPAGNWAVMLHGNAFLQFLNESGTRAAQQAGSIN
jgi:hypothetical protein